MDCNHQLNVDIFACEFVVFPSGEVPFSCGLACLSRVVVRRSNKRRLCLDCVRYDDIGTDKIFKLKCILMCPKVDMNLVSILPKA